MITDEKAIKLALLTPVHEADRILAELEQQDGGERALRASIDRLEKALALPQKDPDRKTGQARASQKAHLARLRYHVALYEVRRSWHCTVTLFQIQGNQKETAK